MAKRKSFEVDDFIDYLSRVERKGEGYGRYRCYGGYRKDILEENLTEREEALMTCGHCKGIMREASVSSDGELLSSGKQVCSCCCGDKCYYNISDRFPNFPFRRLIGLLKCSCPLKDRGCSWLGTLNECLVHLDKCGYVYDRCSLECGKVLQRNELKVHEKENCGRREIPCPHFTFLC